MQKTRETKILELLGQLNNQSFAELRRKGKMGTESLVLGLKELMEKKLVKQDKKTKRYSIQSDSKNKTLQLLEKNNINKLNPKTLELLRHENMPFETGYTLLRSVMFTLSKLTLGQNDPDLTSYEKREFKNQIKLHNEVIEKTFDILYSIDLDQTLALKKGLDTAITQPDIDFKLSGLANRRQRRRAKQL